ncbi:hypothetical protein Pla22_35730 [Rubripirellula amarantea]|uniref:Uncharacterized protein n=1 Tax=Rubripirellula amarantea TaxID=2527999 RepID=A0A5C5WJK0_9BACT|nr:hypothetical protein Pla22_35730 [Rubripirellula amarantea]
MRLRTSVVRRMMHTLSIVAVAHTTPRSMSVDHMKVITIMMVNRPATIVATQRRHQAICCVWNSQLVTRMRVTKVIAPISSSSCGCSIWNWFLASYRWRNAILIGWGFRDALRCMACTADPTARVIASVPHWGVAPTYRLGKSETLSISLLLCPL